MRNIPGFPKQLTGEETIELMSLTRKSEADDGFMQITSTERERLTWLRGRDQAFRNAQLPIMRTRAWAEEAERLWSDDDLIGAKTAALIAQAWGSAR